MGSMRRLLLLFAMVLLCSGAACSDEQVGLVEIHYQVTQGSSFLLCADIGATEVEAVFYENSGDTLPFDVLWQPCADAMPGVFTLSVATGTYDTVQIRLITSSGATAVVCMDQTQVPALVEHHNIRIDGHDSLVLDFDMMVDSTCTN